MSVFVVYVASLDHGLGPGRHVHHHADQHEGRADEWKSCKEEEN